MHVDISFFTVCVLYVIDIAHKIDINTKGPVG